MEYTDIIGELVRDCTDVYPRAKSQIRTRIESLLELQKVALVKKALDAVPEDFPCEKVGPIPPSDPLVAADQARNYTLKQWRESLKNL